MVTTFYPPHHFGGDAVFVHRLSHALADRGHEVEVCNDPRDARGRIFVDPRRLERRILSACSSGSIPPSPEAIPVPASS
ncbi:MAG: glycosyltransferase family 4 protein [Nitrospiraceae bacterium]|nr:glycosyltransferase family 4 protein [Nitrospiraceae bacterium]